MVQMTLASIRDRYDTIADRLSAPARHRHFFTTPQHDGSCHVELVGSEFHYVVTERGTEYERWTTSDADELLFWLVSDLTREMAMEWELKNRIEGEDFRRQFFSKHVELMAQVNEAWGRRTRLNYEKILEEYPFKP